MRAISLMLLAVLMICSPCAFAATWVRFSGAEPPPAGFYFDQDSIRRSGDEVKLWTKQVHAEPKFFSGGGRPHLVALARFIFRCDSGERALIAAVFYADREMSEMIRHIEMDEAPVWEEVIPGSVENSLMALACKK